MSNELSLPEGIRLSVDHGVYCRDDNALAISDLHLGYEAALQSEHVAIPRFQIRQMLERLERLIKKFTPELIIINGDMKHEFSRNKSQEWDEVDTVLDAMACAEVTVVRGNHDNYLQAILAGRGIRMTDSFSVSEGRIVFLHGHKAQEITSEFRIFGHEHPMIRLKDEVGALVQLPCFLYDESNRFLIMPAFSPLASGTNVISPESGFMNPALRNLDLSDAKVIAIHEGLMNFGRVGDLKELRDDIHLDKLKIRNRRM